MIRLNQHQEKRSVALTIYSIREWLLINRLTVSFLSSLLEEFHNHNRILLHNFQPRICESPCLLFNIL